jgi:predicted RNase H-like HicB family nuclease
MQQSGRALAYCASLMEFSIKISGKRQSDLYHSDADAKLKIKYNAELIVLKGVTGLKYKIPVLITRLENGDYMARSEPLRATATGVSREDAVAKLKEAILEMVNEFGERRVFEDLESDTEVQMVELAL